MKKQGKSLRILSIFLSLVMVLCLTVLVGCGNDTKDYAVDIFDSGAYEKLEYGRFLKADEDIPNDYFIYIYDFSSLKDTLNVEVCSDDEDCDFLAKRNDYVKQYLDMAIEAGYKVYIMDASDLEENKAVLNDYPEPTLLRVKEYTEIDEDWTFIGNKINREILNILAQEIDKK